MCRTIIGETFCCVAVVVMGNITVISVSAIDDVMCGAHTVFFAVIAISLLIHWSIKVGPVERSYLPSRTARTILMLALIAIQVLVLLKDILSAVPRVSSYVTSLLTVVGTGAGLLYSDIVGNSRPLSVAILLLLYWIVCSALWLLRLIVCFLLQSPQSEEVDVCLILDTVVLLVYVTLVVLECARIISNVSVFSSLCFFSVMYRVCQKSDALINYRYVNIMSYKLQNTRYLHCLNNNFNICYY